MMNLDDLRFKYYDYNNVMDGDVYSLNKKHENTILKRKIFIKGYVANDKILAKERDYWEYKKNQDVWVKKQIEGILKE